MYNQLEEIILFYRNKFPDYQIDYEYDEYILRTVFRVDISLDIAELRLTDCVELTINASIVDRLPKAMDSSFQKFSNLLSRISPD